MLRGQRHVKARNIPRQRDVNLNELTKQIFMLLPLLLHWLYFSFWGPWAQGSQRQRQQHANFLWQFIQHDIPLPGDVKGLNIQQPP